MYQSESRLNILYIKLKFLLTFQEDTIMPRDKVSALRGGMGEMLLQQNCVNNRNCRECCFKEACMVHRTLYTQMKQKPAFMQGDDSIGYLIECENYRTEFQEGEEMFFYLTLFGNNIVYFSQYLQAFYQLGNAGIGKYRARYYISGITTEEGNTLLRGNDIHMNNFHIKTVKDYVAQRRAVLERSGLRNEMVFYTPLSLKYQGKYRNEFIPEAIFQAVFRRIQMLDYFSELYLDRPVMESYPEILSQTVHESSITRYSTTQDSKIRLKGITGKIQWDRIPEEYLDDLLAGELLHIGKNSSFGFGRYLLM